MTVIKYYSENKEVVQEKTESVDDQNIEQFKAIYPDEIVQGYYLALTDILAEIKAALYEPIGEDRLLPHSDTVIRNNLQKFHKEKKLLLERFAALGVGFPEPLNQPTNKQH